MGAIKNAIIGKEKEMKEIEKKREMLEDVSFGIGMMAKILDDLQHAAKRGDMQAVMFHAGRIEMCEDFCMAVEFFGDFYEYVNEKLDEDEAKLIARPDVCRHMEDISSLKWKDVPNFKIDIKPFARPRGLCMHEDIHYNSINIDDPNANRVAPGTDLFRTREIENKCEIKVPVEEPKKVLKKRGRPAKPKAAVAEPKKSGRKPKVKK